MSNTQPTPITDKNGKQTTVHKKTGSDIKDSRVRGVAAPPKQASNYPRTGLGVPFPDDPNNTAIASIEALHEEINSLTNTLNKTYGPIIVQPLSETKNAVIDALNIWQHSMMNHDSLAESYDDALSKLLSDQKRDGTPLDEFTKKGYLIAAEHIGIARPEGRPAPVDSPKTTTGYLGSGKAFADDPRGTVAESFEDLQSGIDELAKLMVGVRDPERIFHLGEKAHALADATNVWNKILGEKEYAGEAKQDFLYSIGMLANGGIESISESQRQGYELATHYVNRVDPQRPPSFLDR
jgi:hypothetical protein